MQEASDCIPAPHEPSVAVHTYNPSTQEMESGRLQGEDQPKVEGETVSETRPATLSMCKGLIPSAKEKGKEEDKEEKIYTYERPVCQHRRLTTKHGSYPNVCCFMPDRI